jgi:DNA-binding MarR family transcriptional regulator
MDNSEPYPHIVARTTFVIAIVPSGKESRYDEGMAAAATATRASRATPWLDAREMAAWRTYVETVTDLQAALAADLEPTGLTPGDYQVLVYLSEAEGHSVRMCDLAASLQLSPSGLTRRLDGLVQAGWVERRASVADRRVMLAHLTEQGFDQLVAAAPVHVASVRRRMIDLMSRDELDAIASVFGKVRTALDAP